MATRFRRTLKLAPGLRLNVGKRGLSLSAGTRGAKVTFGGKGGTRTTIGLPGTGLSHTTVHSKAKAHTSAAPILSDVHVASNEGHFFAAVLSLILPGLGQLIKGDVLKAVIWLIAVLVGYGIAVPLGFVAHAVCVYSAWKKSGV